MKQNIRIHGTIGFFDLSYIKYGSKNLGYRPDYLLFRKKIDNISGISLRMAYGYNRWRKPLNRKQQEYLRREKADIGWHMKIKEATNDNIYDKIIYDAIKNSDTYASFIFFSGNSELYHIIKYLTKELKRKVIVLAFRGSYSYTLQYAANSVITVDSWLTEKKKDFRRKYKKQFQENDDYEDETTYEYQYSQGPIFTPNYPDQYSW